MDLGILYRHEPPPSLDGLGLDIAATLEAALHRPVDLVVLNHVSPDLIHHVLRDGVLLLETDRSARIRFEVKSRSEYFDVLPYLRQYRHRRDPSHDRS
ncbi:nucleotidyltransferase domain-containing protein [Thiohalomonas denitrificans]|uniref:nucleotidyltransferase domain-containing protein n=1 Tax=Thiohalomonas denitrificans TaxID=415747 RepID=UPI001FE18136|nr:nucleotidyltransferase domain-containing protein [Thiohalomonas denitrificans]